MRRAVALLAAALLLAGVAGCGGDGAEPGAPKGATLVLDFTPNAVHSGIYAAQAEGFYATPGVDLTIHAAGRIDRRAEAARRRPHRLRDPRHPRPRDRPRAAASTWSGVMPIVQRPLAAVIARGDGAGAPPARPRGPHGRRHRPALRRSRGRLRGQRRRRRPGRGRRGDDRLQRGLLARRRQGRRGDRLLERRGRGAAAPGRPDPRSSRSTEYGAPPYPELVLTTSRQTLDDDPELVDAVVAATRRGYAFAEPQPDAGPRRPARRRTRPSTAPNRRPS